MNLKTEALKACIFILIGAYLFSLLHKPEAPQVPPIEASAKAESSSNAAAKCVVKKTTDSKGNVTETIESSTNADNSSNSEASVVIPNQTNSSLDIFLGAGVNNSLKAYGSLEFIKGKNALEFKSDFNKDHSVYYKRKVLEWQ